MNTLSVITTLAAYGSFTDSELDLIVNKVPASEIRLHIPQSLGENLRNRLIRRMGPQDALIALRIQSDLSQAERLTIIAHLGSEGAIHFLLS